MEIVSDATIAVPRPIRPAIRFKATEYRAPIDGEYFWADGDQNPSVCRMLDGMDLSHHNNGLRWILVVKRVKKKSV